MTRAEKISEMFELNKTQKTAFDKLKKAFKECEKSGLFFYNNYGTLGVCDSQKIIEYNDTPSEYEDGIVNNPNEIKLPCYEWSDDRHYFHVPK